jgi:hypothetical protein
MRHLHNHSVLAKVLHQAVDPADVCHEVSQVREQDAFVEIWHDLRMTDLVSSDPCELKDIAD